MKQWHIVSYDIRDTKRLKRVHAYVKQHALPLQKSVYLLHASAAELADFIQTVRARAHLREDDIRIYPITHVGSIWAVGTPLPSMEGLFFGQSNNNSQRPLTQREKKEATPCY